MKSTLFVENINKGIEQIRSKSIEDREDVVNIFKNLVDEFLSLKKEDFDSPENYVRYTNTRNTLMTDNFLIRESIWLSDRQDESYTSDNYFQVKTTLLAMLIPFQ